MADTEIKTIADELKTAAAKLREMAKNASRGPWIVGDCELYPRWMLSEGERDEHGYRGDVTRISEDEADVFRISDADWRWMGFAHPGLAEPLASWLESAANEFITEEWTDCPTAARAVAVARVINGTTPEEAALHG